MIRRMKKKKGRKKWNEKLRNFVRFIKLCREFETLLKKEKNDQKSMGKRHQK